MDYRSLASLALRLSGVFILVSTVAGMPNTFVNLYALGTRNELSPSYATTLLPTVLGALVPLLVGFLLIYFPSAIANRVIPKETNVAQEGTVSYRDMQTLGFSVLGLYFFCIGFFDASYWVARGRLYYLAVEEAAAAFPRLPSIAPDEFGGLVSAALHIIGGIALFVGSRGLSGAIERLRGRANRGG